MYPLLGPNFETRGQVPFLDGVGRIERVLSAIDAVYRYVSAVKHPQSNISNRIETSAFRGFIATPARSPQRITRSVTERLFGGADMATINIQVLSFILIVHRFHCIIKKPTPNSKFFVAQRTNASDIVSLFWISQLPQRTCIFKPRVCVF